MFERKKQTREHPPLCLCNTLTGNTDVFTPLRGKEVRMYNCGPTVYDRVHIGNLRSYVFADILKRVLAYNGYTVRQVINMTDVGHLTSDADTGEDKMTLALEREGLAATLENMRSIGERYTEAFKADIEELGVDIQNIQFPRASDFIEIQVALITSLVEKGYAYTTSDGVYFDTKRFPEYGKLGEQNIEEDGEHSRIGENAEKRHAADFALWKFNSDIGWESPWGRGFPGWHIECSAMAYELLGKQIDIHTGGMDHIAVHHNNEIAQTESITGKPFARYWLHNAFLTVENQKIAKSVGNTIYLYHLKEHGYSSFAFRYWLLTGHYRSQMNFTWDALNAAQTAHRRLLRHFVDELNETGGMTDQAYEARFHEYINDDLDTPKAVALTWDLIKDESVSPRDKRATLLVFDRVLGLGFSEAKRRLAEESRTISITDTSEEVQALLNRREEARKQNDFETADAIREKIREHGFEVTDTPDGPTLRHI